MSIPQADCPLIRSAALTLFICHSTSSKPPVDLQWHCVSPLSHLDRQRPLSLKRGRRVRHARRLTTLTRLSKIDTRTHILVRSASGSARWHANRMTTSATIRRRSCASAARCLDAAFHSQLSPSLLSWLRGGAIRPAARGVWPGRGRDGCRPKNLMLGVLVLLLRLAIHPVCLTFQLATLFIEPAQLGLALIQLAPQCGVLARVDEFRQRAAAVRQRFVNLAAAEVERVRRLFVLFFRRPQVCDPRPRSARRACGVGLSVSASPPRPP